MDLNIQSDTDENQIVWKDLRNGNGNQYQVGYVLGHDASGEREFEANRKSKKKRFGAGVTWVVGTDDFKSVGEPTYTRAAISKYALYDQDGSSYQYRLKFININGVHYDYYFYDETGDYYRVDTLADGEHFVRYNSSMPNIAYILGQ